MAFCGGCKPEIDRRDLLQKVKDLLPDHIFQFSLDGDDPVACLLILNGCPTACRTSDFSQHKNRISVRGEIIGDRAVREERLSREVADQIILFGAGSRTGSP
ncbi:hypothetical protein [Candidatus Formimonas warabiya]|uniref:hypothetical protein n=1 Tax=Formimonas warabiya TaxID=1761012 RepID=UPI001BE4B121|nr:hypothetical protein [Candidatus Formimonas warabiya]